MHKINSSHKSRLNHPIFSKRRTIIALLILYSIISIETFTGKDMQWAWGILFLLWVIPDLLTGITYFIEPIDKRETPVLYWIITITWLLLCFYSFSTLFIDYEQFYY